MSFAIVLNLIFALLAVTALVAVMALPRALPPKLEGPQRAAADRRDPALVRPLTAARQPRSAAGHMPTWQSPATGFRQEWERSA